MRIRIVLAIILLAVGLCFVPGVGHGEVSQELYYKQQTPYMHLLLLKASVDYIMRNPTNFLNVEFFYDPDGRLTKFFSMDIETKGKICVDIRDSRGVFFNKSGVALLELFKRVLETLYSFVEVVATDMDTDIVGKFYSTEGIPLGYFCQGEYHLWER